MKVILVQADKDYEPELGSALADVIESLRFHEIKAVVTETDLPSPEALAKARALCLEAINRLMATAAKDDKTEAIADTLDSLSDIHSTLQGIPVVTVITPGGFGK